MIPSDKQIHVILPVLPGRMIPGREMLDKIERMIVNSGSDDVDYFVCVPEGGLTAEDKRAIRIDHRKERFLEVPLESSVSLTGFADRKQEEVFSRSQRGWSSGTTGPEGSSPWAGRWYRAGTRRSMTAASEARSTVTWLMRSL